MQPIFKPALMQYMTPPPVPNLAATNDYDRDRWTTIKNSNRPDLTPLIGFYSTDSQEVIDKQLMQLSDAGVDCIDVDVWWDPRIDPATGKGKPAGVHALYRMLNSTVKHNLKICVSLDTDNNEMNNNPVTLATWNNILDWMGDVSTHPMFFKHKGRKVIKWLKFGHTVGVIGKRLSLNSKAMMDMARRRISNDAYMIAGVDADEYWTWEVFSSGCDAHGFYNMFNTKFTTPIGPQPTSFDELWANYMATFAYMVRRYSNPAFGGKVEIVPTYTDGWNSLLMQGGRLIGVATREQRLAAMKQFNDFVMSTPLVSMTNTNAFNEYYESPVFEPTQAIGRERLNDWTQFIGNVK